MFYSQPFGFSEWLVCSILSAIVDSAVGALAVELKPLDRAGDLWHGFAVHEAGTRNNPS